MNWKISLIILMSIFYSCKKKNENSDTVSLQRDLISGDNGLLDAGIYVTLGSTTTYGEIFSENYRNKRWSGDRAIDRDEDGYNENRFLALSPKGYFFLKAKPLKSKQSLTNHPRSIRVLEGTIPNDFDCSEIENGNSLTSTNVSLTENNKQVDSKKICYTIDETHKTPYHIRNRKVTVLPIKQSQNGKIVVEITWPRMDSNRDAKFRIQINNLNTKNKNHPIEIDTESEPDNKNIKKNDTSDIVEITPRKKKIKPSEVPSFIECESLCTNSVNTQSSVKALCESMNDWTSNNWKNKASDDASDWLANKEKLNNMASQCKQLEVYRVAGFNGTVNEPVFINHFSSHGVEVDCTYNRRKNCAFADLRIAKAFSKALKELKSEIGLKKIEVFSLYRPGAKVAKTGNPSKHGNALAIDVSGMYFKDGKRIDVKQVQNYHTADKNNPYGINQKFRKFRSVMCKYFDVFIGPEGDSDHDNHLHMHILPESKTETTSLPKFYTLNYKKPQGIYQTSTLSLTGVLDEHPPIEPETAQLNLARLKNECTWPGVRN